MRTIRNYLLLTIFLTPFTLQVVGQDRYTVSGYVSDSSNSERLMGANIRLLPASQKGAFSNNYGFYSFTMTTGEVTLACSFVGYQTDTIHFYLKKDTAINFQLSSVSMLKEITVNSRVPIEQQSDISHISIPVKELAAIPSFMGEKDIIKAIQWLPGVQTGNDGSTGLYIRGGGPGQNLILLDGVPVYNISHLFGFFSVFTPEAIQSVDLYKGGFPARYGGRLSSVLDIRMKDGDMKKLKGDVSVGLLSAKLSLQGPIKKNKSSFIISARRTYLDLLAKPFIAAFARSKDSHKKFGYYFQDYTAKFNDIINDKNRVYLSFYGGNDQFYGKFKESGNNEDYANTSTTKARLGWGNITGALRWNRTIGPKLFSNLTLSYTRFRYFLKGSNSQVLTDKEDQNRQASFSQFNYLSHIRDWSARLDFDYAPSPAHAIKFGGGLILHRFQPGIKISKNAGDSLLNGPTSEIRQGSDPVYSRNLNFYGEDEITFNDHLKADFGLRLAIYNANNKNYYALQPRFSGRYLLGRQWSIKAGYARMFQPLHLLVNSGAGFPVDLWVPATRKAPPAASNQYTLGFAKTFQHQYELTAEAYYKTMNNVIAYKDGADFTNTSKSWQDKIDVGRGYAHGLELSVKKKSGNTTGWISYTLAWNQRQFPAINNGKRFPYKFDRRHDLKLVFLHQFSKHIRASAGWVFASGNTVTLPVLKYNAPYNGVTYYTDWDTKEILPVEYVPSRNNFRMRPYHRLDLSVDFIKEKKKGNRIWNISIYNAYARQNPYFYYYEVEAQYPYLYNRPEKMNKHLQLKQFSLFSVIPSVTYRFEFK